MNVVDTLSELVLRLTGKPMGDHISHGFFRITGSQAKTLANGLPREGYQKVCQRDGSPSFMTSTDAYSVMQTPVGGVGVWSIHWVGGVDFFTGQVKP